MPDPITGAEIEELESLQELTQLRGWRVVRNLLNSHRIYCVEQSNRCLEKHEDRKAGEWLARSKECPKLLTLIQNRKQELSDRKDKENE